MTGGTGFRLSGSPPGVHGPKENKRPDATVLRMYVLSRCFGQYRPHESSNAGRSTTPEDCNPESLAFTALDFRCVIVQCK